MLSVQPSLFGASSTGLGDLGAARRIELAGGAWVDHLSGWLTGSDAVLAELLDTLSWQQRTVWMYERYVDEPRLSAWWRSDHGPEPLPILAEVRHALDARYGVSFDSIGFNLYRNGDDSVAWHGDTKGPPVPNPVIAILSVGTPRPLRLRPRRETHELGVDTGARGEAFGIALGDGDLFVMGGTCQRTWEHAVPKVRHAEPRMSITYRHSGVH